LLIISFGLITNSETIGRILSTFMGILTDLPSTIIALIVGAKHHTLSLYGTANDTGFNRCHLHYGDSLLYFSRLDLPHLIEHPK